MPWTISGLNINLSPIEDGFEKEIVRKTNVSLNGKFNTKFLYKNDRRNFRILIYDEKGFDIESFRVLSSLYSSVAYLSFYSSFYFSYEDKVDWFDSLWIKRKTISCGNTIMFITSNLRDKIYLLCIASEGYIIYEYSYDLIKLKEYILNIPQDIYVGGICYNSYDDKFFLLDTRGRIYEIILGSSNIIALFSFNDFSNNILYNNNTYIGICGDTKSGYVWVYNINEKKIYEIDYKLSNIVSSYDLLIPDGVNVLSFFVNRTEMCIYVLYNIYNGFSGFLFPFQTYDVYNSALFVYYLNNVNEIFYELKNKILSKKTVYCTDDKGIERKMFIDRFNIEYKKSDYNRPCYIINISAVLVYT